MAEESWGPDPIRCEDIRNFHVGDEVVFTPHAEHEIDRDVSAFYLERLTDGDIGQITEIDHCDQRQPFRVEFRPHPPMWVYLQMLSVEV